LAIARASPWRSADIRNRVISTALTYPRWPHRRLPASCSGASMTRG